MKTCCTVCPYQITCDDLNEMVFAELEDIMQNTDLTDLLDEPDHPGITLAQEVCSSCYLELPVTMICEDCDETYE